MAMGIEVVPDVTRLTGLANFVDDLANCSPDVRAPFVGATAFAHKGGMHVNAVQKNARSFEHIEPGEVGNRQRILVSELSGQSNVLMKAEELGLVLEKGSAEVMQVLTRVKEMEQQGYDFESAEATFELLIRNTVEEQRPYFELQEYYCSFRRDGERDYDICAATVKLRVGDEEHHEVAEGDGPVNALDAALRKGLRRAYPMIDEMALEDYKVRIIDSHMGTAAKTRVLIVSSDGPQNWSTVGVSYNIIQASWRALVDSLHYFLLKRGVESLG